MNTAEVITPGVLHLCHCAIVNPNPPIKYSGNYFQEENNNQLGFAQLRLSEEFYFCYEPGKNDQPGYK